MDMKSSFHPVSKQAGASEGQSVPSCLHSRVCWSKYPGLYSVVGGGLDSPQDCSVWKEKESEVDGRPGADASLRSQLLGASGEDQLPSAVGVGVTLH